MSDTVISIAYDEANKALSDAETAVTTTNDLAAKTAVKTARGIFDLISNKYQTILNTTFINNADVDKLYELVTKISNGSTNAVLARNTSNAAVKAAKSAIDNIKIGNYTAAAADISLASNYASASAASAAAAKADYAYFLGGLGGVFSEYIERTFGNFLDTRSEENSPTAEQAGAATSASATDSALKAAEAVSSINNYIQTQRNSENNIVVVVAAAKAMGLILTSSSGPSPPSAPSG
jgi:hypothetical protein